MAINGFPAAIQNVIEQVNYLETKFHKAIHAKMVLRAAAAERSLTWFDGQIGETKTFTRSNPITPLVTPQNPANNTGLDNGITPVTRGFEQWQATLDKWTNGVDLNVLGNETLLGDLFVDNAVELAEAASNSIEVVCVQRALTSYDSGDTFVTATTTGANTHVLVDNITGFDTQYLGTVAPSYGLPAAVSASNKMPIIVLDGTTGLFKGAANVTAAVADVTNTSYMQQGSGATAIPFGQSGYLTLDSAASTGTLVAGDRVVAMDTTALTTSFNPTFKDGSYVVRPLNGSGKMIGTAYAMGATDIIDPTIQVPQAVALLSRRQVPRMRNGLYGCAIDSTVLAQFYQDEGFQRATMGTWERGPVFANGIIAKGWGVEFVEASQLPVYSAPNPASAGTMLRHAFCFGEDVISEHPFAGARGAASNAAKAGDVSDVRWSDRIMFINQAPLDRLFENVKMSYKYTGDFRPGTDKGSNPTIVFTSDYCRFKRGVEIQVASPF